MVEQGRDGTTLAETADLDRWDYAGNIRFPLPLRLCGLRRPQGQGRRVAGRGVQLRGTTTAVRDQDGAPPATRTGRAGDHPAARLRDDPSARGDDRQVRLSAGRLQEGLSDDRPPQAT